MNPSDREELWDKIKDLEAEIERLKEALDKAKSRLEADMNWFGSQTYLNTSKKIKRTLKIIEQALKDDT